MAYLKLSCNDINRYVKDLCNFEYCINVTSCCCCHMMCRACFAPAVYKFSCSTCETCSHVCITKGKDWSFFVNAFSYNEFEVSVSVLCNCKICNRACIWIELCQVSASCFAVEYRHDLHGRFLVGNISISTS